MGKPVGKPNNLLLSLYYDDGIAKEATQRSLRNRCALGDTH